MPSLASIPFGDDILYLYIGIRRLLRCPASHHSEDGPHEAVEREVPITQASSDDVRVGGRGHQATEGVRRVNFDPKTLNKIIKSKNVCRSNY